MQDWTANDIFRIVGLIVCWVLAIVIGLIALSTIGGLLIAFASTGVGAIILALIAWRWWRTHNTED